MDTECSLPAELVLEIFRYLSLPDRIAARAVCRVWHNLADTCPVTVPIDHLTQAQLRCYLAQLRAAPLLYLGKFDISGAKGSTWGLVPIVADHMARTVIIDLDIRRVRVPEDLRMALGQRAPLLERLRLELSFRVDIRDVDVFGHFAPRLTYCAVHACAYIIPAIAPFKTIHTLILHGLILYNDVEMLFSEFPVLEELSLDFELLDGDDHANEAALGAMVPLKPPASLVHLTIAFESEHPTDLEWVFSWIQHESIRVVAVRHYDDSAPITPQAPMVLRMLKTLVIPAVTSLVVSCSLLEGALRLVSSDGRQRVHAGLSHKTLAELLGKTLLPVRDLVLIGIHVLYDRAMYSLDHFIALRTLTIVLRPLLPEGERISLSLFIPPISCPDLKTVTLAITDDNFRRLGSVRLSAKEVRDFLRDKLQVREDCRTLKTLCFRGVSVEDISPLQDLAEEIRVQAHEPLTRFVYPENDLRRFDHDDLVAG